MEIMLFNPGINMEMNLTGCLLEDGVRVCVCVLRGG